MKLGVDISPEQYQALKDFAERHNVTVSDILKNYIADLVQINSNGSDERDHARSYFDRTHLSWMYKDDPVWREKMEKKFGYY